MSIRLLRESSDTPNITNRDDTHMTRYAYGNISGVVKDFGSELSYSTANSKFSVGSGRVVIQGWEVEIEPGSWMLDLSTVTGSQYYLVYLEINTGVETAEIKSMYLPGSIPSVEPGDDLTKHPQGVARLPLYTFRYNSGTFSNIIKVVKTIPYSGQRLDKTESDITTINQRLDALGFKSGVASLTNIGFVESDVSSNTLMKQGKMALFKFVSVGATAIIPPNTTGVITVPEGFRPKTETLVFVKTTELYGYYVNLLPIKLDGTISISANSNGIYQIEIVNAGWQLP